MNALILQAYCLSNNTEKPWCAADMEVTEAGQRQQVEEQVEKLLAGQGLEVSGCDVALDQSKPATLRKNVTYIVCAVVFNDKVWIPAWSRHACVLLRTPRPLLRCVRVSQEEVLMVQEAKPDCYKQWYLPAGRVEVGENLQEALKREVSVDSASSSPSSTRSAGHQLTVCR